MPERRPSMKRPGVTATGRQWQVIEALEADGWKCLSAPERERVRCALRDARQMITVYIPDTVAILTVIDDAMDTLDSTSRR